MRRYAIVWLGSVLAAWQAIAAPIQWIAKTGHQEHLRNLREGIRAAIPRDGGNQAGKGLAQMIFFTPHALGALED